MSDTPDGECIHGLGPISACVLCNGRAKREAQNSEVSHRFVAQFKGYCNDCGAPMLKGEDIAVTNDGRYICGECAG